MCTISEKLVGGDPEYVNSTSSFTHLISVQFIGFIRLNIASQDSSGKINFKRLTASNAAHYSLLCSDLCSVVSSTWDCSLASYTVPHKQWQARQKCEQKGDLLQKCFTTVLKKDSYCVVITCHLLYLLFTDSCRIHSLLYLCLNVFSLHDVTGKITMVTRCRQYTKDINNLFYKLFLHILSPLSHRPDIEIITTSYIHDYSQYVTDTKDPTLPIRHSQIFLSVQI